MRCQQEWCCTGKPSIQTQAVAKSTISCLKQYLLFEVGFVLVLLLELVLAGLGGKHIASGKLGRLDVGETCTVRENGKKLNCEFDQ